MSDIFSEFLVQISTSVSESQALPRRESSDGELMKEFRRCLYPGAEIALVFEEYAAITTILWLSDLQPDGSVRVRVRLLGLSALSSSTLLNRERILTDVPADLIPY